MTGTTFDLRDVPVRDAGPRLRPGSCLRLCLAGVAAVALVAAAPLGAAPAGHWLAVVAGAAAWGTVAWAAVLRPGAARLPRRIAWVLAAFVGWVLLQTLATGLGSPDPTAWDHAWTAALGLVAPLSWAAWAARERSSPRAS